MHTHVHTCIYIYECIVDTSIYISLYEYAHYITPNMHKKETLFCPFPYLSYLYWLAHRNEEWDQFLHEVFEVSPSELSVSTRKQASALRLRPDRRVIIGLSTILEVSVSIRHLPHWPLRPDQYQMIKTWVIWVRVHQHLQCLFSCIPLHFNMWCDLQVHLNKISIWWKSSFCLVTYFKKWNCHIFYIHYM